MSQNVSFCLIATFLPRPENGLHVVNNCFIILEYRTLHFVRLLRLSLAMTLLARYDAREAVSKKTYPHFKFKKKK